VTGTIKAISLWEPWASLMAYGAKICETRSWSTSHRGPLAIQAAKRWALPQREFCRHPRVRKRLEAAGIFAPDLLPRGMLVAVVDLVDVVSTDDLRDILSPDELCFGDYSPGRFVWVTDPAKLVRLSPAIPCIGHQGLFEVPLPHRGEKTC
jgi:hypothetical protein